MTNKRVHRLVTPDWFLQPHHAWRLDATSTFAGEREPLWNGSRPAVPHERTETSLGEAGRFAIAVGGSGKAMADPLLDRGFADQGNNLGPIGRWLGNRSAAYDRRRLRRGGDPTIVSAFEIATAIKGRRNSDGTAMPQVFAQARTSGAASPWELHHANEETAPLPHWVRGTRPSQTGMVIPGLIAALGAFAAASGILSTVVELASL